MSIPLCTTTLPFLVFLARFLRCHNHKFLRDNGGNQTAVVSRQDRQGRKEGITMQPSPVLLRLFK